MPIQIENLIEFEDFFAAPLRMDPMECWPLLLCNFWARHGQRYPKSIYHYTSVDAAYSILRNHVTKLWLSSMYAQNDTVELRHGQEFILDNLKVLTNFTGPFSSGNILTNASTANDLSIFSLSATVRRDYAPFWLSYGHSGKGVCIELDARTLLFEHNHYPGLVPAIYTKSKKRVLLDFLIQTIDLLANAGYGPERLDRISKVLSATFLGSAKFRDFAPELEFRIVSEGQNAQHMSSAANRLKRYVEQPVHVFPTTMRNRLLELNRRLDGNELISFLDSIPCSPITSVIIGQAVDDETYNTFATLQAQSANILAYTVVRSRIPLRG